MNQELKQVREQEGKPDSTDGINKIHSSAVITPESLISGIADSSSVASLKSRRELLEAKDSNSGNVGGVNDINTAGSNTSVQNINAGHNIQGNLNENTIVNRVGKKISDLLEEQGKNEEMNILMDGSKDPKNKDGESGGPDNVEGMNRKK